MAEPRTHKGGDGWFSLWVETLQGVREGVGGGKMKSAEAECTSRSSVITGRVAGVKL